MGQNDPKITQGLIFVINFIVDADHISVTEELDLKCARYKLLYVELLGYVWFRLVLQLTGTTCLQLATSNTKGIFTSSCGIRLHVFCCQTNIIIMFY